MIMAAPGSRSEGLRMRVFPVTAAMGMVHSGIILTRISMEYTHQIFNKAIRGEVEGSNTSTNAEWNSSDLGIHVLAHWKYKGKPRMWRLIYIFIPSIFSPKRVEVTPIDVSTT